MALQCMTSKMLKCIMRVSQASLVACLTPDLNCSKTCWIQNAAGYGWIG